MRAALLLGLVLLLVPVPVGAQAAYSGEGVTVAVLDTGVDGGHAELSGRVTRVSFASSLPLPLPGGGDATAIQPDPDGQGTAVASVVAGSTLGVAPNARILDLQVSARYSGTALDPAAEEAAIRALDYLLQDPSRAQVAVLSFAQQGLSPTGAATIAEQARGLWDAGIVVVVPNGPAANALSDSPYVLTIAGIETCPVATQSPYLKPDAVGKSQGVRAAAPGTAAQPGGEVTVSGTAYAAAFAAGVAALMQEARDDLPIDARHAIIRSTALDQGDAGPDACSGFGAVDGVAAPAAAAAWEDPFAGRPSQGSPGLGVLSLIAVCAVLALRRRT